MKYLNYMLAISALVVTATGCIKENTAPEGDSACKTIPATLSVPSQDDAPLMAPSTKVSLNGTTLAFTWNSGDKIAIMGMNASNTRNEFTTTDEGKSGADFTGTVTEADATTATKWYGVNPYSAATSFNQGNGSSKIKIPASQTGYLADVGSNYISIASEANHITNKSSDPEVCEFQMGAPLTPFCSVVKLNVPEVLAIKRIVFSAKENDAPCGIAGEETIKLSVTNVCKDSPNPSLSAIEITRDNNVISGDVYICVLPNRRVGVEGQFYKSSADAITLRLVKGSGAYWEKTITLNAEHPLAAGKLVNFGTVSASIHFTQPSIAAPTLEYTNEKKLIATSPVEGVTFYYTTDPACEPEDPTISSEVLPAEGVTLTSSQYIKVIAALDDDTVSSIAEANLRYWDCSTHIEEAITYSFSDSDNPAILSHYLEPWLVASIGSGTQTLTRRTNGGVINSKKNPYVHFNITSRTAGSGSFYVNVKRDSKRYLQAKFESAEKIDNLKPASEKFEKIASGTISKGGSSWVRLSHGDESVLYTLAFFETGDVDFPAPTCLTPSFTYADGKVQASSTTGATIYYTVGDSVPANPTTSSEVFPADGLALASGKYFKAYAVKDGYNDSAVATGDIRIWNYTDLAPLFDGSVDLTVAGAADYTSSPERDLVTDPYTSGWITLSAEGGDGHETSVVKVKGNVGYRYPNQYTHISFDNILKGNGKLYIVTSFTSASNALYFRPSDADSYTTLGAAALTSGSLSLAANKPIEAGETSDFYLNRENRISKIIYLESGTSTALMSISNQSFE